MVAAAPAALAGQLRRRRLRFLGGAAAERRRVERDAGAAALLRAPLPCLQRLQQLPAAHLGADQITH